jgi:hypothetical protein
MFSSGIEPAENEKLKLEIKYEFCTDVKSGGKIWL